ncbi:N-6 DNA methylase [Morganella morganii]|uniref:N-6 DNA methylase n=2 Tax=Morganella morganii TaxID=582 RepID=UPI0034E5BDB5
MNEAYKNVIDFNQYYTSKSISDLLSGFITLSEPKTCLELSAGEGALLDALKARWPSILCTTIDIDPTNHLLLKKKFPQDKHYCTDATSQECNNLLNGQKFDLAVCNPPFQIIKTTKNINNYISNIFGEEFSTKGKIRAELVFLAINIFHINTNGVLAIIVPELIVKGVRYQKLRKILFSNFKLQYLIECKHKSFRKTEAKTFIVILKKEVVSEVYKYFHIKYDSQSLIYSEYCSNVENLYVNKNTPYNTLSHNFEVIRGNLSGKLCRDLDCNYIHTTNMNPDMDEIIFDESKISKNHRIGISGDIIISRVGTRVLGKTNYLSKGSAVISDCVFAVRFKREFDREKFIKYWSKHRSNWINENATGTCAKHITKSSLASLIISIIS